MAPDFKNLRDFGFADPLAVAAQSAGEKSAGAASSWMPLIHDRSVLYESFRLLDKQAAPGVDGQTLDEFESALDFHLYTIHDDLKFNIYRPDPLKRIYLLKPDGGRRAVNINTIRDRVTQRAILIVLSRMLDSKFSDASFAYRPGRSVRDALLRLARFYEAGCRHVFLGDIETYFDRIDRGRLSAKMLEFIPNASLRTLILSFLGVPVEEEGRPIDAPQIGVPQGTIIAPFLSNLFLNHIDWRITWDNPHYIRYSDNILIACPESQGLAGQIALLEELLAAEGLNLNLDKSGIYTFEDGFEFLGGTARGGRIFVEGVDVLADEETRASVEQVMSGEECLPQQAALESAGPEEEQIETTSSDLAFMRTLYVQGVATNVGRSSNRLVIRVGHDHVIGEVPMEKISQVIVFGESYITTPALRLCLKSNVPVIFLSGGGKYMGRLESADHEPVDLPRIQFSRLGDAEFARSMVRSVLRAKIHNSLRMLRRGKGDVKDVCEDLKRLMTRLEAPEFDLESLRGIEGAAAAAYFSAFGRLLKDTPFTFEKRTRRPPLDPVNSLLSFGYAVIYNLLHSLVRVHGLFPYLGHLHALREGHPALVSDLIEEFRAPIVDTLVMTAIRRKQVVPEDFEQDAETGATYMKSELRRSYIEALERRLLVEVIHPQTGYQVSYKRVMDLQIRNYIRFLRGQAERYEAFLWRG